MKRMIREKVGEPGERSKTSKVEVFESWSTVVRPLATGRWLFIAFRRHEGWLFFFFSHPVHLSPFTVIIVHPFLLCPSFSFVQSTSGSPSNGRIRGFAPIRLLQRRGKKLNLLHRVHLPLFSIVLLLLSGSPSSLFTLHHLRSCSTGPLDDSLGHRATERTIISGAVLILLLIYIFFSVIIFLD